MSRLFSTFVIEKRTITKPYGNTDKPHKMTIYVIMMKENRDGAIWSPACAAYEEEEAIKRIRENEEWDRQHNNENKYDYRYEEAELY